MNFIVRAFLPIGWHDPVISFPCGNSIINQFRWLSHNSPTNMHINLKACKAWRESFFQLSKRKRIGGSGRYFISSQAYWVLYFCLRPVFEARCRVGVFHWVRGGGCFLVLFSRTKFKMLKPSPTQSFRHKIKF